MWKRIALKYPVWYEPKPLACYRAHQNSDTTKLKRDASNIIDRRLAIKISRDYIPPGQYGLLRTAKMCLALEALKDAQKSLGRRNTAVAKLMFREALKTSLSWKVIARVVSLSFWAAGRLFYHSARRLRGGVGKRG